VVSELTLLHSADVDIQIAYERYESQQDGRGEIFLRHLDVALERLRKFPRTGPLFHRTYRRLVVPAYPFGIFYSLAGTRIVVAGVIDLRQDPENIQRRLNG
jgi:hypothetical protein